MENYKAYNVLILDDLKLVGENINKRVCKADFSYSFFSCIRIKPHYEMIDISSNQTAANQIAKLIDLKK